MSAASGTVTEPNLALASSANRERLLRGLGLLGLAVVVGAAVVAAFGAWSAGQAISVDRAHLHGGLLSPLAHVALSVSHAGFLRAVVVMFLGYALVVASGRHVPVRLAFGATRTPCAWSIRQVPHYSPPRAGNAKSRAAK